MKFVLLSAFLTVLTMLTPTARAASDPRTLNVLRLIADVLYASPANNDFIKMVENQMMDEGMMNLIEDMALKFSASDACEQFKDSGDWKRSVVETRLPSDFTRRGGNYQSDLDEKELLDALNSQEGLEIITDKAAGKSLNIPPPRYNSGQFQTGVGRKRRQTSHVDISDTKTGTQANRSILLMARVAGVIKNKWSRQLFVTALDDGTVRAAMYNICHCNGIASTLRYFYDLGTF